MPQDWDTLKSLSPLLHNSFFRNFRCLHLGVWLDSLILILTFFTLYCPIFVIWVVLVRMGKSALTLEYYSPSQGLLLPGYLKVQSISNNQYYFPLMDHFEFQIFFQMDVNWKLQFVTNLFCSCTPIIIPLFFFNPIIHINIHFSPKYWILPFLELFIILFTWPRVSFSFIESVKHFYIPNITIESESFITSFQSIFYNLSLRP